MLLNKLAGVTGLPNDAKTPTIRTSNSDDSPIARLVLRVRDGYTIDLESQVSLLKVTLFRHWEELREFPKLHLMVVEDAKCVFL